MFGAEAVRRIGAHADQGGLRDHGSGSAAAGVADDTTDAPPFFLYLAMQDVHEPVSAPANYIALHADIDDGTRRTYAGMVSAMDSAIGNVTDALKAAKMWNNTVFVISNDNGGWLGYGGLNFPYRGDKTTLYDDPRLACPPAPATACICPPVRQSRELSVDVLSSHYLD